MTEERATRKAKKALDSIVTDEAAWGAMVALVNNRALRDQIVMRRLEQGLTQKELAKRMDVGQATVSEFETCRYPDPHLSTLRRYYMALGLHVSYDLTPTLAHVREMAKERGVE